MPPSQCDVRNLLLQALSPSDFARLQPHLVPVSLSLRQVLIEPDMPIEHLYFVESGLASVTTPPPLSQVEVGMIGWEGLVGASPVLLGIDRSPFQTFVQMSGEALQISTEALRNAIGQSPSLNAVLLRFIQALMVQTAETAFANVAYTIESRLARWLLMCRDRSSGDELALTHEFLSVMLGVHRPGVTIATQVLEGNRLIKANRGRITILNRDGLMAVADGGYGLAKAEQAAIIGSI